MQPQGYGQYQGYGGPMYGQGQPAQGYGGQQTQPTMNAPQYGNPGYGQGQPQVQGQGQPMNNGMGNGYAPQGQGQMMPSMPMQHNQAPMGMQPNQPPMQMQPSQPPMQMQPNQPPMQMQPTQPPMQMQPNQPPMQMQPNQPPMQMQPQMNMNNQPQRQPHGMSMGPQNGYGPPPGGNNAPMRPPPHQGQGYNQQPQYNPNQQSQQNYYENSGRMGQAPPNGYNSRSGRGPGVPASHPAHPDQPPLPRYDSYTDYYLVQKGSNKNLRNRGDYGSDKMSAYSSSSPRQTNYSDEQSGSMRQMSSRTNMKKTTSVKKISKKQAKQMAKKNAPKKGGFGSTLMRKKKNKKQPNPQSAVVRSKKNKNKPRMGSFGEMELEVEALREESERSMAKREKDRRNKKRAAAYRPKMNPEADPRVQGRKMDVMNHLRKQTWTVQWSEDYKRPYYFNKFTGESMWDPPQEIL